MTDQDVARVAETLRVVLRHLREPDVDVVWSQYGTVEEAIENVEAHIHRLESGDTTRLGDMRILFAPTGSFQEIAICNGWGNEFLRLSEVFDAAIGENHDSPVEPTPNGTLDAAAARSTMIDVRVVRS